MFNSNIELSCNIQEIVKFGSSVSSASLCRSFNLESFKNGQRHAVASPQTCKLKKIIFKPEKFKQKHIKIIII